MNRLRVLFPLLLLTLHVMYGQGDTRVTDSGEWRVIDVTTLPKLANSLAVGSEYLVSPDGTHLTWLEGNWIDADSRICLMALPSNVRLCHTIPDTYATPSLLSWSPDSRYVLLLDGFGEFSGQFTFEPATQEFSLIQRDEYILLSEMKWNSTSDAVFYLTYHYIDDKTPSTALRRFSLTTDTETLYDLTPIFGAPAIFNGLVSVSEDDSRFVVLLTHHVPPELTPGLWLVDITAQTAEHLASFNDLQLGVRPEAIRTLDEGDLVWDARGNRLIVATQTSEPQFKTMSVLSVNLENGEITTLLSPEDSLASSPGFLGGTLTPDAEFFFYFTELVPEPPYKKTIFAVPLASPDHAPITVTDVHPIDCLPTTALITLEHMDGEQQRYVYEPHIFCPG